MIGSVKFE